MHRWVGVALASALCGNANLAGAAPQDAPAVELQTTLGDLLSTASKEMGLVIVYDEGLGTRVVAISRAPEGTTARALLEQGLQLFGLRLEVDLKARVGRIVRTREGADHVPSALAPGAAAPDGAPGQLVTRVIPIRHADASQIANVLYGFVQNGDREWVRATRGTGQGVVITVRAERLPTMESVVASLDQPAAPQETVEVVRVQHGRTKELAPMVMRMCGSEREGVRAEAGPDGNTIALVGPAWRVAQAKALIAGLDVPGEGK